MKGIYDRVLIEWECFQFFTNKRSHLTTNTGVLYDFFFSCLLTQLSIKPQGGLKKWNIKDEQTNAGSYNQMTTPCKCAIGVNTDIFIETKLNDYNMLIIITFFSLLLTEFSF